MGSPCLEPRSCNCNTAGKAESECGETRGEAKQRLGRDNAASYKYIRHKYIRRGTSRRGKSGLNGRSVLVRRENKTGMTWSWKLDGSYSRRGGCPNEDEEPKWIEAAAPYVHRRGLQDGVVGMRGCWIFAVAVDPGGWSRDQPLRSPAPRRGGRCVPGEIFTLRRVTHTEQVSINNLLPPSPSAPLL